MTTANILKYSQPPHQASRNRLHNQALSMKGLAKNEFGSGDLQSHEHADQLHQQTTDFMSNVPSSSHVNLAEIENYHKKR